jgi:hypothetical protein
MTRQKTCTNILQHVTSILSLFWWLRINTRTPDLGKEDGQGLRRFLALSWQRLPILWLKLGIDSEYIWTRCIGVLGFESPTRRSQALLCSYYSRSRKMDGFEHGTAGCEDAG